MAREENLVLMNTLNSSVNHHFFPFFSFSFFLYRFSFVKYSNASSSLTLKFISTFVFVCFIAHFYLWLNKEHTTVSAGTATLFCSFHEIYWWWSTLCVLVCCVYGMDSSSVVICSQGGLDCRRWPNEQLFSDILEWRHTWNIRPTLLIVCSHFVSSPSPSQSQSRWLRLFVFNFFMKCSLLLMLRF